MGELGQDDITRTYTDLIDLKITGGFKFPRSDDPQRRITVEIKSQQGLTIHSDVFHDIEGRYFEIIHDPTNKKPIAFRMK